MSVSACGSQSKKSQSYGIVLKGAAYVKIYQKKGHGSFTIPNRIFDELWGKDANERKD